MLAHLRRDEAPAPQLSASLVDSMSEVVALPPDAASRAVAIEALLGEIHDTVEWVHAADDEDQELVSFGRVLAETRRHSDRMQAPAVARGVTVVTATAPACAWSTSDVEVSSYDDLSVTADAAGRVVLACPTCGHIPVPSRETTLSDLTNAAMEHLSEQHPYTLTLPSRRTKASGGKASARRDGVAAPRGYFTEQFWSLIGLLSVSGLETLVRALASSSETDILDFREQLRSAVDMLDTPHQRVQQAWILGDPLRSVSAALSDSEFEEVRVAVVAAGRDVWLDVLAEPTHLAVGWSLQLSRGLLEAPEVALRHRTARTPLHPEATADHRNISAEAV